LKANKVETDFKKMNQTLLFLTITGFTSIRCGLAYIKNELEKNIDKRFDKLENEIKSIKK